MDDEGHGTHCAGVVAAAHDGQGMMGMAKRVQLMALKFMDDSGAGYLSDALQALDYALDHGAVVSSNSWGSGGYDPLTGAPAPITAQQRKEAGVDAPVPSPAPAPDHV